MLGRPPFLRQDECPTLLRRPDESCEDVLAGLPAVLPICAAAATFIR
jgi:hypothetical protein